MTSAGSWWCDWLLGCVSQIWCHPTGRQDKFLTQLVVWLKVSKVLACWWVYWVLTWQAVGLQWF